MVTKYTKKKWKIRQLKRMDGKIDTNKYKDAINAFFWQNSINYIFIQLYLPSLPCIKNGGKWNITLPKYV